MAEQFENPDAAKLEDETVSDASAPKRVEHVAEKAAEKSTKIVQQFDSDNSQLFSR
jgi:hypothetical protein